MSHESQECLKKIIVSTQPSVRETVFDRVRPTIIGESCDAGNLKRKDDSSHITYKYGYGLVSQV